MRWAKKLLSYNFIILYYKGLKNGKANTLSCKTNYFKDKKQVKYLILRTNQNSTLSYNYMVLVVIFRVKNNKFIKWLRMVT